MNRTRLAFLLFLRQVKNYGIDHRLKSLYFLLMQRTQKQLRIHTSNTIHHVMVRGNNRQCIFFGDEYFSRFLMIIKESAEKFDHKVLAYCLMTNHVHFVIQINQSSLSDIMQNISYRYSRWVNKIQNRVGHLFQGRYRSIEVNDETYLINLCRYIHLNPIVANMATSLNNYLWSSHKNYATLSGPEWLNLNFMIDAIQNKTGLNYHHFMDQLVEREKWKPALSMSESGEIIINNDLVREFNIKKQVSMKKKKLLEQDVIASVVSKHLMIDLDKLYGPSRERLLSKKRILLAHYLLKYSDGKKSDIAKKFNRTQGTLSRQIEQFNRHPEKYFSKQLLLQKIEMDLDCRLYD